MHDYYLMLIAIHNLKWGRDYALCNHANWAGSLAFTLHHINGVCAGEKISQRSKRTVEHFNFMKLAHASIGFVVIFHHFERVFFNPTDCWDFIMRCKPFGMDTNPLTFVSAASVRLCIKLRALQVLLCVGVADGNHIKSLDSNSDRMFVYAFGINCKVAVWKSNELRFKESLLLISFEAHTNTKYSHWAFAHLFIARNWKGSIH